MYVRHPATIPNPEQRSFCQLKPTHFICLSDIQYDSQTFSLNNNLAWRKFGLTKSLW